MNYKLYISYDGTNFSGWQIQPNVRTIQQDLQNAIREIYKDNTINLYGSGRTDSGVHAYGQIANFSINTAMSVDQIIKAINSKINRDIYVYKCEIEDDNFNSRFSAVKREYITLISINYMIVPIIFGEIMILNYFVNHYLLKKKIIVLLLILHGP